MERSDGQMAYAEGGVEMFRHWPVRIGCGVNMLCVHGRADVSTGIEHYRLQAGAELLLFPGAILHLLEAGEDLAVRMFTFPDGLFHEAAIPLDAGCIRFLRDEPFFSTRRVPSRGPRPFCGWIWPGRCVRAEYTER